MKAEAINLKEKRGQYMRGFEVRKGENVVIT